MPEVNATLCLPFRQPEHTVTVLTQTIIEACKRTCCHYEEETAAVLSDMADILELLLSANLIESISVDFGVASLQFTLRYDASPEDEDELDIELLDLVLEPPSTCVITLTLVDPDKAAFLCCADLEQYATEHVSVILAPVPEDEAEEGEE
jgi:hypothetical protein